MKATRKVGLSLELKYKPLTFLHLRDKKPKPLSTFDPLIEDDFLILDDWRDKKKPIDEKEVKRKMKKVEKDAVRELKKDTIMI
jgi:hypothetical protein